MKKFLSIFALAIAYQFALAQSDAFIRPTVDTYVSICTQCDASRSSANFGSAPTLWVNGEQYNEWGTGRALLKFDVAKIPTDAKIIKLRLYATSGDTRAGFDSRIQILRMEKSWDEMSVTWNTPTQFDRNVYAEKVIQPNTIVGWHEWDITGLVKDWQGEKFVNHGLMLFSTAVNSNGGFRIFVSADDKAQAALAPQLQWVTAQTAEREANNQRRLESSALASGSVPQGSTITGS